MGKFEDNIKNRLNQGEIPLSDLSFSDFEKKLDALDLSNLKFSQKIKGIFDKALIPFAPEHWIQFQQKYSTTFEQKIKQKLNNHEVNYTPKSWEQMETKLAKSKLTSFEKKIAEKIGSGSKNYNPKHWESLAKRLNKSKKPVFWPFLAAAAFTGLIVSYWAFNPSDDKIQISDSNETKMSQSEQQKSNKNNNLSEAAKSDHTLSQHLENETHQNPKNKKQTILTQNKVNSYQKSKIEFEETFTPNQSLEVAQKIKDYQLISAVGKMNGINPLLPTLDKQSNDDFPIIPKTSAIPLELSSVFNFWDNAALTGVYGKHHASLKSIGNWKTTTEYESVKSTNYTEPLDLYAGFESQIKHSGFSVGSYYHQQWTENWSYKTFNVSTSYHKNIFKSINARVGLGLNYQNNKINTEDLYLAESYTEDSQLFVSELDASKINVPNEQFLKANVGALIQHPNFMLSYNLNNAVYKKANEKSVLPRNHNFIGAFHLPEFFKIKISALLKIDKDLELDYSPGIGISLDNKLYTYAEYSNLNRMNLVLGYQHKNKLRAYLSYGFDTSNELESRLVNAYSVSGQLAAGINCILK